jgi:hypothetical protein
MTNGLLIYEEIFAHFLIYEEVLPHLRLCNCSTLNFLIFEENFIFFFISALMARGVSSVQSLYSGIFVSHALTLFVRLTYVFATPL